MPASASPEEKPREAIGTVPARFATPGPRSVPRVDTERIFVMDASNNLIGEYALNDDCPLESADLKRSIPVNGLRHLVSFYQGEYTFTPFRVDDLWFVILTRGVPRIEDRGSIGTLLAAARVHIPPMMEPLLAKREKELRAKEQELADREVDLTRREQRAGTMDTDLRVREAHLATLQEYAVQVERTFVAPKSAKGKDAGPSVPLGPT